MTDRTPRRPPSHPERVVSSRKWTILRPSERQQRKLALRGCLLALLALGQCGWCLRHDQQQAEQQSLTSSASQVINHLRPAWDCVMTGLRPAQTGPQRGRAEAQGLGSVRSGQADRSIDRP